MEDATKTTCIESENSVDKIVTKLDKIENEIYDILNQGKNLNYMSIQTQKLQNGKNIKKGIDCGFFIICDPTDVQQKKQLVKFWEQQRRDSEKIRDAYDASEESKYIAPGQINQETNVQNSISSVYDNLLNSVVYEQSQSICSTLLNYPENMIKRLRSYKSFLFISSQSFFSGLSSHGNTIFSSDFSLFSSVLQSDSSL